jgi:hypothetical protein
MLQLMMESKRTLDRTGRERWSAEAINFVEATSLASPDELSNVSIDNVTYEIIAKSVSCIYS